MISESWLLIFRSCSWQNQACFRNKTLEIRKPLCLFTKQPFQFPNTLTLLDRENSHLTPLSWCLLLAKGATQLPPQSCTARPRSHPRAWKCSVQLPDLPECSPLLLPTPWPCTHSPLPKSYWITRKLFMKTQQENVGKQHLDHLIATFTVTR